MSANKTFAPLIQLIRNKTSVITQRNQTAAEALNTRHTAPGTPAGRTTVPVVCLPSSREATNCLKESKSDTKTTKLSATF
ncbi:hypothetical protein E2C01_089436 [Portunus trituberculatus]|uniref:Uncharacterized protein n=1 Tax=Portunus trituberculatus TaxID=210409 RepID=A0A5B7JPK8_PORTR|nr:hypothetical protein [Portunus trituberculatus]